MSQILGDGKEERIPPPPPSFLLQVDFPVCIHLNKKVGFYFSAGGHLEIEFVIIHGHMLMIATQVYCSCL